MGVSKDSFFNREKARKSAKGTVYLASFRDFSG
jgi:hypothetical protein